MKKIIIVLLIALSIITLAIIPINMLYVTKSKNEIIDKYRKLEAMLIPTTNQGNIDFEAMNITDHQDVAYCLKTEARLGENKQIINELTQYLVDHADENNDGEIGWGLGFAWSGFYTDNPKWHVYAIEVANVMDAYIEALNSQCLSEELSQKVKNQLHYVTLIWNQKYWCENGTYGEKDFYWYSISEANAIGCINTDAKMVGWQARLLNQYEELFTEEEKNLIYDHIDHCYLKIIENSYLEDGYIKWNYLEKKENPTLNDAIHHAFILDGIYDYQKYRTKEEKPLKDVNFTTFIEKCVKGNIIYRMPDHKEYRCFDTGAIRWILDKNKQRKILLKSFDLYYNTDTDRRQLTFLLDAFSLYISSK